MTTTFRNRIRVGDPDAVPGVLLATLAQTIAVPTTSATVDVAFVVPAGAVVTSVRSIRSAAAAGTPTNVNLTSGSSAGGTQYIAAADIKAAGITSHTLVAVPTGTVYVRLATVGGTSPTGSVVVVIEYIPA